MNDWQPAVGEPVAILSRRYSITSATLTLIERETRTQWVAADGGRYYKKNLRRVGHSDSWHPNPRLADPDSREVSEALQSQRLSALLSEARGACNQFHTNPTVESAGLAIESIRAWMDEQP